MAFHVGQMVVAVVDGIQSPMKKGQVYTIREIVPEYHFLETGVTCGLKFDEIVRYWNCLEPDIPMAAIYFRPVRTTNISIFTSLLAPTERETV